MLTDCGATMGLKERYILELLQKLGIKLEAI